MSAAAATGHEPTELPDVLKGKERLSESSSFCFGCHAGLKCFTDCCSDVNIVLTPLDVLGLARQLGVNTRDFLEQYTQTPITKKLHLPLVMLKMGPEPAKRCPFVQCKEQSPTAGTNAPAEGGTGCSVYDARPWACRMYPVATAIPPARAGVEPKPQYFLLKDGFCHGHGAGKDWTVEGWRRDQGIVERDELEKGFQELVSHPWFIGGRELDPKRMEMFFTAVYDLDAFREFIFTTTFLKRFVVDEALVASLKTDDHALLHFAYRWLRFALFGEPTMERRASADAAARGNS